MGLVDRGLMKLAKVTVIVVRAGIAVVTHPSKLNFIDDNSVIVQVTAVEAIISDVMAAELATGKSLGKVIVKELPIGNGFLIIILTV